MTRGRICGVVFGAVAWGGFMMVLFMETSLQIMGLVYSLAFAVHGDETNDAFQHVEGDLNRRKLEGEQLEIWMWLDPLIRFAVFLAVCIIECCALYFHWSCYIKPEPQKYIPVRAIVPQDLKGRWRYGICEWFGALGTCCCFTWFPACMFGDYWYRAGWLPAKMSNGSWDAQCPGWPFFAGVLLWCGAADAASCCMCCGFAVARGGMSWVDGGDGGLGNLVPMRKRFEIPHDGMSTFVSDCCLHCWCGACAATQEYRQVIELLNRGPVQEEPPPQVTVGAPVVVIGQPVVGQPVSTPSNEKTGA